MKIDKMINNYLNEDFYADNKKFAKAYDNFHKAMVVMNKEISNKDKKIGDKFKSL
jgi:hypothetical protein